MTRRPRQSHGYKWSRLSQCGGAGGSEDIGREGRRSLMEPKRGRNEEQPKAQKSVAEVEQGPTKV